MTEFRDLDCADTSGRADTRVADAIEEILSTPPTGIDALIAAAAPSGANGGRAPTRVLALQGSDLRVHLRLAQRGGWLGALLPQRFRSEDRGAQELELTARLYEAGLPVVRPLLALGQRRGIFWQSLFGSVHQDEALNALEWLGTAPSAATLRRTAGAAGRAVRRLHDEGIVHGDLHLCNLLISTSTGTADAQILDFDGARKQTMTAADRMAELMRLYRSLLKHRMQDVVGVRGCATFMAAYCDRDRSLRAALLDHLGREQRRIRRHQLRLRNRFESRSDRA